MQPCPALPAVPDAMDMGDLLDYGITVTGAYNECAARHQSLIDVENARKMLLK